MLAAGDPADLHRQRGHPGEAGRGLQVVGGDEALRGAARTPSGENRNNVGWSGPSTTNVSPHATRAAADRGRRVDRRAHCGTVTRLSG
jgi:hypothetical protein